MNSLNDLRQTFPDTARDIKLNMEQVLASTTLSKDQIWGIALACALATRHVELSRATLSDATTNTTPAMIADAQASAALMAMNNVYYRTKHFLDKDPYKTMPAKLRMQYIARPQTSKAEFELLCLAVSAIGGCEACVKAHEHNVTAEHGITPEQVNDAIRIAATFNAAATSLTIAQAIG